MPIQTILLVDDSRTELHVLSELLTKRGYMVRTAENGDDALKRLQEEPIDLILMDVVMPGQNGFQLTRAITRDPQYTNIPVIICSSKNLEGHAPGRQGLRGQAGQPRRVDRQDQGIWLTRHGQ